MDRAEGRGKGGMNNHLYFTRLPYLAILSKVSIFLALGLSTSSKQLSTSTSNCSIHNKYVPYIHWRYSLPQYWRYASIRLTGLSNFFITHFHSLDNTCILVHIIGQNVLNSCTHMHACTITTYCMLRVRRNWTWQYAKHTASHFSHYASNTPFRRSYLYTCAEACLFKRGQYYIVFRQWDASLDSYSSTTTQHAYACIHVQVVFGKCNFTES